MNNPVNLLVQFILPFQGRIEIVGPVRPLLWTQDADSQNIPQYLLQRLAVFLIHGQQKEGKHDQNHTKRSGAATQRLLQEKEKGHANQSPAAKTD